MPPSEPRSPEAYGPDGEPVTATGKPYKRPSIVACTGCRAIKVKCRLPTGEAPTGVWEKDHSKCTRCIRLGHECIYQSAPRRGRRPKDRHSTAGANSDEGVTSNHSGPSARDAWPEDARLDEDPTQANAVASTSTAGSYAYATAAPSRYPLAPPQTAAAPGDRPNVPPAAQTGQTSETVQYPHYAAPLHSGPSSLNALLANPPAQEVSPRPPIFPVQPSAGPRPPGLVAPSSSIPAAYSTSAPPVSYPSNGSVSSGTAPLPPGPAATQPSPALSNGMHASPASQGSASVETTVNRSLAEESQVRSSAFQAAGQTWDPAAANGDGPRLDSRPPDPIDLWILSEVEAQNLISLWHDRLNCYVILLDRHLHTYAYVRAQSPVLFTAMLATAAKFFRPELYPRLLSTAHSMITRAMGGDLQQDIGLLQAILLLVYWKEPRDSSAWMRVGYAIRLGYSLRLYRKRTGPLPADEFEARILLDRERTWIVLICFDRTVSCYTLREDAWTVETRMITAFDVDIDAWLRETQPYGVTDDAEQGVSMSLVPAMDLCRAVGAAPNKLAAQCIAQRAHEVILSAHRRYFEEATLPGLTPLRGPSSHKARFHLLTTRFELAQACLTVSGMQDELVLSDAIIRAGDLVECFEEAVDHILVYVQDTIAVGMLAFGEWTGRLFPHVSNAHQTTLVRYLSRLYVASCRAQDAHRAQVASYLVRFFRGVLRAIHPQSMPATRPASPHGTSHGQQVGQTAAPPAPTAVDVGPFEQLSGMEQEIFTDLDALFADLKQDTTYWDSLNPTLANSTWAWLDEALAVPP